MSALFIGVNMARKRKTKHKPAKIDTRVSEQIKYGAELMARKMGLSISGYVGRALEDRLSVDGIGRRQPGELDSLLDRLWSVQEDERIFNLAVHAPELMSDEEQSIIATVMRVPRFWRPVAGMGGYLEVHPDRLALRGGLVDLEETGIFWELIVRAARGESVDWKKEFADYDAAIPQFETSLEDFD
jgi:hypothetical protein